MKKTLFLFALLGLALLLAGCTQPAPPVNNTPTSPNATPPTAGATVVIKNFAFEPATLNVSIGTTVTWTNQDSAPHQLKSNTFNSESLSPGQSYSHKFDAPGMYQYSCAIHPSMKGTIIVQ